jgi:hypothetical protein
MKNFMHFYEQITTKTLHIRMNDVDISFRLGQLVCEYFFILSFKV